MSDSVLIIGLGKSGIAAAEHALAAGDTVTVYGGPSSEASCAAGEALSAKGAKVIFDSEAVEGSYDYCVASPGIPQTGDFYAAAQAASTEVISEPEYAFRVSPVDWVAVTGTNGKTTTTSLITHLISNSGKPAAACGNIGDTAIKAVEQREEGQILVVETSSYQLASTANFAPEVAVLLNITPDHLAWHGGFDEYAKAKLKVFANMAAGSTAILCQEVPGVDEIAADLAQRGIKVVIVGRNAESGCAYEADGKLYIKINSEARYVCDTASLQIQGAHNVANALASTVAAVQMGCELPAVAEALVGFAPLEHRIEPAGEVDGVGFFNDSKATNVDSTLVAITAFGTRPVILMVGGRDKGTDLTPLVEACKGPVRTVIAFGEAGQRFYDAFADSGIETILEPGMRAGFDTACKIANSGDVVLLSPACASFDEFNSFGHRGQVFKEWVRELQGARQ